MVACIFVTVRLLKKTCMMRRDVFQAIADPTRRSILGLLSVQSLTLNSIVENYSISRPAISKHMKLLAECGLVEIKQEGRERYCSAKFDQLKEVNTWINQYKQFWEHKLDNLESYIYQLQKNKKNAQRK